MNTFERIRSKWPKSVRAIYNKYVALIGEEALCSGAGHVVWEDLNFEREAVQDCIDNPSDIGMEDLTPEQKDHVYASLRELLALPKGVLESHWDWR